MHTDEFGRPVLIMLVEDNPADVRLVKESFGSTGVPHFIAHYATGEEALERLRGGHETRPARLPDMIILDFSMPRMDGKRFLSEVKSDEELKGIPVIVMSASQAPQDIRDAYRLQANCYVTKPGTLRDFREMVAQVEGFWFKAARLPMR